MDPSLYKERFYRGWQHPEHLVPHEVRCGETDLQVFTGEGVCSRAVRKRLISLVLKYRAQLEETIKKFPPFLTSLVPVDFASDHEMIRRMVAVSRAAGVGPMAGVAGAVAEFVGTGMLAITDEIIVENGGDVFLRSGADRTALVYAGEGSPFRDRVRIKIRGRSTPVGLATSSRKIGSSLSFGNTDATLIIAGSALAADVFATTVGNMVKGEKDLPRALEYARTRAEISGGLILIGDRLAAFGEIELA